ncbi:MAG: hypothetical protein JST39_25325, partial [Bacteroidetes bacterium]|nr:hypothetical protein [Bacteroidota bacterium]
MKWLFFSLLTGLALSSFAQLSREQRIQDSIIGWDPTHKYDALKPPATAVDRRKEAYLNKMVEWMQKSYTPIGGLGEYQRFINPQSSQVLFSVWDVGYDYLDAQKHFRPIGETGLPRFYMSANILSGVWNIDFMNKPDAWYFTMQPDGYCPTETEKKKRVGSDRRICELAHPYLTWINEWCTVYLTPGNKLPMKQVTKGELLQTALKNIDGVPNAGQYRNNILSLLEKYKNALDEPASVPTYQFSYRDFITGSYDVFTRGPNTIYYPVYTIDAATIAKMKEAQPLWIAVTFPFEGPTDGNKSYEMYVAMTKHLNYEYIYNYFFDTAKVHGKPYIPADAEGLKARLDGYRKKNAANINAQAETRSWAGNVHFQDDFSGNTEG